jgi:hypothetical protein
MASRPISTARPGAGRARCRRLVAPAAVVLSLGLVACGGATAGSTAPASNRAGGFRQSAKVVACLKKYGVTLPAGRRGPAGGPPPGGPPAGVTAPAPGAPPPTAGSRPRRQGFDRNSAQARKFRQAAQKCGLTVGRFRGRPPAQTVTTPAN